MTIRIGNMALPNNCDGSNSSAVTGTSTCRGEFKRVRGEVQENIRVVNNLFETFCYKGRREMPCWLEYLLLLLLFCKNRNAFTCLLKNLQI